MAKRTKPAADKVCSTEHKSSAVALKPHLLADTVPGDMDKEEFEALCISVKDHGLRQPIVLFEGQILDGRHRYKACYGTGKLATVDFKGTAVEAAQYVLDTNLHRRKLTGMQKALVGARLCTRAVSPLSQRDAAAAVGCSPHSVNLMVQLLESKNTMEIKRVENGEATREEIDQFLVDRSIKNTRPPEVNARVPLAVVPPSPKDDDDDEDDDENDTSTANIVALPTRAGKRNRAHTTPRETPASTVAQAFKALTEADRMAFVELAWTWLEPALLAANRPAATSRSKAKKTG